MKCNKYHPIWALQLWTPHGADRSELEVKDSDPQCLSNSAIVYQEWQQRWSASSFLNEAIGEHASHRVRCK